MKRFRFTPDPLLGLRRRKLERLEAELAALQARRESSLERAADLERRSAAEREQIALAPRIRGADLRVADACERMLLQAAQESRRAAHALDADLARARHSVLKARRDVEVLEALRDRKLTEWRRAADKQEEALAAELYLARHRR